MRWEDGDGSSVGCSVGTPSRVVQYEAPNLGPDDIDGVWRIDDTDHSFSSQAFRIKFARQDVLLSVMISFNLSLSKFEVPSTSAVILKFELMYAPVLGIDSDLQVSLDANPAAVHEFRIPPKALLGLHSYCPVHFDIFHAVLVDTSVHTSMLKGGVSTQSMSDSNPDKNVTGVIHDKSKQIMIIKAFLTARAIILEELQKLSKSLNQRLDLTDSTSRLDETKVFGSFSVAGLGIADAQVTGELSTQSQDLTQCDFLYFLSKDELFSAFHLLGDQLLYLWSTFLKFLRVNKTKILEHLCEVWANDQKSEWSSWLLHSKVEIPHHYMSSAVDDSSYHGFTRKTSVLSKLTIDPSQTAAMRAELHRRSIAQMRISNRSIQDMHIFGDPSHIPIIIIERLNIVSAPMRAASINSYFRDMDRKDKPAALLNGINFSSINKLSSTSFRQSGCVLKIVIFVHGFQGHHLDLRLVRNQWLLIDSKVEFLMSEVNEEKTSGDFRAMGLRLANEVISFVKRKMENASRTGGLRSVKLSFVGHSIGNVIIRTALAETCMEPYLQYLYTYVSISGPHLGYLYSSNSLFNSGLWLLKKLKGTQCIHQLTLTDDPDLQNTFFYKLCKQRTLNNFKNVILLSSPQDGYVPYHSARIEMCQASSRDFSKKGKVFLEMLNECMDQIRAPSSERRVIMRGDVNFDVSSQGRNLNTVIGRTAHIEFLENDIFARFIMWSFPELFR